MVTAARQPLRLRGWAMTATGLAGLVVAGLLVWLLHRPSGGLLSDEEAMLARLGQTCIEQMVSETCSAAIRRGESALDASAGTVVIAGLGVVDAKAYDELQRLGGAMCARAVSACRDDSSSDLCRVALQMWAPPSSVTSAGAGVSVAPHRQR